MNIKGLRVFVSVMSTGSLVSAAREMNTSVSALSRQLSMLEDELDLLLFTRDKKRLTPTEHALAFLPEVETLLGSFDEIPSIAKEIKRLPSRRLRIGVMPRMATCIVEPAIAKYMKLDPTADIIVEVQPRRLLERGLLEKTIDLGFGSIPANHENIATKSICHVPAVVMLHPRHKLSSKKSIALGELVNEEFIMMPPNTLLGRTMGKLLDDAGIAMKSRLQVSQTSSCCNFVSNGYGVSISDTMIPSSMRSEIKLVPLKPKHSFDFGLLFLDGSNELEEASHLIKMVREEAGLFNSKMNL